MQVSKMTLGASCLLPQNWLLSLTTSLAIAWIAEFSFLLTQLNLQLEKDFLSTSELQIIYTHTHTYIYIYIIKGKLERKLN